jgi:hypothetical protein
MKTIDTVVVGIRFRGAEAIKRCCRVMPDESVELVAEPRNRYDANAVQVRIGGLFCGYIPKETNPTIAGALREKKSILARIVSPGKERGGFLFTEPKIRVQWNDR